MFKNDRFRDLIGDLFFVIVFVLGLFVIICKMIMVATLK